MMLSLLLSFLHGSLFFLKPLIGVISTVLFSLNDPRLTIMTCITMPIPICLLVRVVIVGIPIVIGMWRVPWVWLGLQTYAMHASVKEKSRCFHHRLVLFRWKETSRWGAVILKTMLTFTHTSVRTNVYTSARHWKEKMGVQSTPRCGKVMRIN